MGYVLYNNSKLSFDDFLKIAQEQELDAAYKKFLPIFHKTGVKPFEMQKIDDELALRGATKFFEKHPPNLDPNFRWTDANRWE